MGLQDNTTEEVALGLITLNKQPDIRTGAAFDAHRATAKNLYILLKRTISTCEYASAVHNFQWRDVYKSTQLTYMIKDVT